MPTVLITSNLKTKTVSYFTPKLSLFCSCRELQFWAYKAPQNRRQFGEQRGGRLSQRGKEGPGWLCEHRGLGGNWELEAHRLLMGWAVLELEAGFLPLGQ